MPFVVYDLLVKSSGKLSLGKGVSGFGNRNVVAAGGT